MSLDNPAVPLTAENLYSDDSFISRSGVRVTSRRALGYPAYWRCVNLISGHVARLPLSVYRYRGNAKFIDESHPAHYLLNKKPNRLMTAFTFKQTLMSHVLTEGNAFAYIDRDNAGNPVELLIVNPRDIQVWVHEEELWYVYKGKDTIHADDMLHFKGLGYDGLIGYPVLEYHVDSMGSALAARDHSSRYYRNGASPGGVIEHPGTNGKLSDPARRNMRESWERMHKGLDNAHKIAILEEGATYKAIRSNARDAQLIETQKFNVVDIANIFGVPPHKVGDSEKVAYNSLGEENQAYYDDTLGPWLCCLSEECTTKLLSDLQKKRGSHCVDFDYNEIGKLNPQAQMDLVTKGFQSGLINRNEGRSTFGLNPVDKGDEFYIPANFVAVGQEGQTQDKAQPSAPVRALVRSALQRLVSRVCAHASRLANKGEAITRQQIDEQHGRIIRDSLGPVSEILQRPIDEVTEEFSSFLHDIVIQDVAEAESSFAESFTEGLFQ